MTTYCVETNYIGKRISFMNIDDKKKANKPVPNKPKQQPFKPCNKQNEIPHQTMQIL